MEDRAVIGLITSRKTDAGERVVNPNIEKAIHDLGGEIRPFNFEKLRLYELVGETVQIDGFIFPGGGDLDPGFYGQEKRKECNDPIRKWDDIEMNLFPLLMTRSLPMLGICRGCQVINVGFGGTLVQDLPSQRGLNHRQDDAKGPYSHEVTIAPGTRLRAAIGQDAIRVNSYHHQAVDTLAPGFKISAQAPDGTIEAIESAGPGQFIMGVQWHPEMILGDPASQAIFRAFMAAVEKRRGECGHCE